MSTRIFYTAQSEAIRLGRQIGTGGEGTVYEIHGSSDLVAKIYHEPPPPEKAEKLTVLARIGAERLFNLSAWPVEVLRDKAFGSEGSVVGFVMKKISEAEEVHTLHSPKSRLQKFPDASWAFLIYAAANIARAVSVIHEHDFVVGDVNPKNILVTRKATVYLLDCDSFQVSADGKTYRCEGGFPEYTPPELQGIAFRDVDRNQRHDCFGLAVVIFQLLFLGRHPFSGRFLGQGEMPLERAIGESRFAYGTDAQSRQMQQPPGTLALESVPASIIELFRRAFLSTERPQAREWIEPLEALAKTLKRCALHSGHYHFAELAECPWCGIEARARIRLFNFLLPKSGEDRGFFRLDEVWKEIETVPVPVPPPSEPVVLHAVKPSEKVKEYTKLHRWRLYLALLIGGIGGFLLGFYGGFFFGGFLLFPAIALIQHVLTPRPESSAQPQTLSLQHPVVSSDPFIRQIEEAKQQAEESFQKLKEQWNEEAEGRRFLAGWQKLRSQKEAYENLAKLREQKLHQLQASAKVIQLEEYLDQLEIANAKISGISSTTKASLLSYGIETAADLTGPRLEQIKSIDPAGAKILRKWRQKEAGQFIFDPAKGVSDHARIAVEREMDELRLRIEHELTGGAYYLHRINAEIKEARQKLAPLLAQARLSLAVAEKDCENVKKPVSPSLAIVMLFVSFFIGFMVDLNIPTKPDSDHTQTSSDKTGYIAGEEIPLPGRLAEGRGEAQQLFNEGLKHRLAGHFQPAEQCFRKSATLDPNFVNVFEELSYALYRLKRYDESIGASVKALSLEQRFESYYHLGLVYAAQGKWEPAKNNLAAAIERITGKTDLEEQHLDAYSLFGKSLSKRSEVQAAIEQLKSELRVNPGSESLLFNLGNLYLWTDDHYAALIYYQELLKNNSELAGALGKLIARHPVKSGRTQK